MKDYLLNKLLLVTILLIFSLSCSKEVSNVNTDPDEIASTPLVTGTFRHKLITDLNSSVGLYIKDDLEKEVVLVYGKKDENGRVIEIERIFIYNKDSKVAFTIKVNSEKLIYEIVTVSSDGRRVTKLTDYDLMNGRVNIEIKDLASNTIIQPKITVELSKKDIIKLNLLKSINLKNGRKAAAKCSFVKSQRIIQNIVQCWIEEGVKYASTCILVIKPKGKLEAAGCGVATGYFTYVKCSDKVEEYEQYKEECPPNLPDLPPPPSPDELTEAYCYENCPDFNTIAEYEKYMEDCKKKNGTPTRTGDSWGDPHLTTTDNFYYDFQGHGEFTVIKSTEDNFEVQVRQVDIWDYKTATVNTAIGVQTGTDIVSITAKPFTIYVNNKQQTVGTTGLPLSANAFISKATINGNEVYTIKTINNDLVKVALVGSDHLDYSLSLNSNRKGKVTGLLGNFDGNRNNDLQTREGKVIEYSFENLYPGFADSWRIDAVSNYAKLLYYESGTDTKTFTKKGFPATPAIFAAQKLKDAESTCRSAGVTTEPFLSSCIYDLAVTSDPAYAKAALWNQQNNPVTGIPYGSDLSEIKNIKVTISNDPITQNDSCLLSLSTGKVFRVKDGAQHASEIDVVFRYGGYNDELYAYKAATAASLSHQGPLLNRELLSQNWSVYKNTALESLGFARDDNPSDNSRVDATLWNYIKTTVDLRNSFYSAPSLLKNTDRFDETSIVTGDASNKSILLSKTLRRFVTQDGKLGVIRFTNWGKSQTVPNSWWITMDVKIQK